MSDKTVGIHDMHPLQVQELMQFCCHALELADALSELAADREILEDTISKVESLGEMFGANAVILQTSPGSTGSEPELGSLAQLLEPKRAVGRRGPEAQGPASEK